MGDVNRSVVCTREITGPSAWRQADFPDERDWVVELTEADLAELRSALAHARGTGKTLADITAADFPLTGLAGKLREVGRELRHGRGFAVIRSFPVDTHDEADLALMYWGAGRYLGEPVTQNGAGEVLVPVMDYGRGGLDNTRTRGYQTSSGLPFHTDSSDVVGLLCLVSSGEGGLSSLASSMTIHNELLAHHRELLSTLYAGFFYDRRGEEAPGERPYYRNAVYGWFDEQLSCRYYLRNFIESAQEKTGFRLSDVERLALDTFEEIASREENRVTMRLRPGDVQLLNNNVIVHARTAYRDTTDVRRKLLRLWLNFTGAPPFPDDFAAFRTGMPLAARG